MQAASSAGRGVASMTVYDPWRSAWPTAWRGAWERKGGRTCHRRLTDTSNAAARSSPRGRGGHVEQPNAAVRMADNVWPAWNGLLLFCLNRSPPHPLLSNPLTVPRPSFAAARHVLSIPVGPMQCLGSFRPPSLSL